MAFDYQRNWSVINCRLHPDQYQIGRGEQGVLLIQPYKNEIGPHWKFRTPEIALQSAREILALYRQYRDDRDFPGMDMCRKYLQMGYTRSRRYANHPTGRKWSSRKPVAEPQGWTEGHGQILELAQDRLVSQKAQSALIFRRFWRAVATDPCYQYMKKEWLESQLP